MEIREVLEKVKNGEISLDEAERFFDRKNYVDLGYAKLDTNREKRVGFPEVVFCSGKDLSLIHISEPTRPY